MIDFERNRLAARNLALLDGGMVNEQAAPLLLRVGHAQNRLVGPDRAGIAHLAAGFAIERRLVDDEGDGIALSCGFHRSAILDERQGDALGLFGVVAEKLGRLVLFAKLEPDRLGRLVAGALPMGAGFGALAVHGILKAGKVDMNTAGAQGILGEVEREAIGVVELEGGFAVQAVALLQLAARLVKQRQTAVESLAEAGLLQLQSLGNQRLGAMEFGIGAAHLADQDRNKLVEHRLARAEQFGVAHGAAHDPAQHIATAFIRRQDAVGDQEGGRAQVIGDDAVAGAVLALGLHPGQVNRRGDQVAEQVDVVIVVLALQHGRDPLKTHAGVDRGARQVLAAVGGNLLILHEHQVPDLDEPVAILFR